VPQNSSKLREIATPNLYLGTGQKSGQSELDHTPQQGKLIRVRLAVPLNDFRNIGKNGGDIGERTIVFTLKNVMVLLDSDSLKL
jgi:hypothetical protein